jgi:hypothetical protein
MLSVVMLNVIMLSVVATDRKTKSLPVDDLFGHTSALLQTLG